MGKVQDQVYPELPDWLATVRKLQYFKLHDGSEQLRLGHAVVNIDLAGCDVTIIQHVIEKQHNLFYDKHGRGFTFVHLDCKPLSVLQASAILTKLRKLRGQVLLNTARKLARELDTTS